MTFSCYTVTASIIIHNGLTHCYAVSSGNVYRGEIKIENTAETSQNVKLYLRDLSYNADGTIHYKPVSTNEFSNANWMVLETNLVTLKPHETRTLLYEIKVPTTELINGSYWSVIMVEPVDDLVPEQEKTGLTITSVVRYAIQVITDYETKGLTLELKFESVSVGSVNTNKTIEVALANIGTVFCRTRMSIELYDPKNGSKIGVFSSVSMGLLPHNSKTFRINIDEVPRGTYKAVLIAIDQNDNAFALNLDLVIKDD